MKAFQNNQEVNPSSCDLNIIVEGQQYGAHWCILREKSTFFDDFYCRKTVKGKSFDGKTCVHLEGVSSKLVGLFLQYVYTSSSKNEKPYQIELNEVNDVLKFSVMFRLKELQTLSGTGVETKIISMEDSHRMSQLHKNLLKFLYIKTTGYKTSNIAKLVAHRAYLAADMDCLFSVLKIVSSNDEKVRLRLKLLDILITLFTVSLTPTERLHEVKDEREDFGRSLKPSSKDIVFRGSGRGNNKLLLRPGLINVTVNPYHTIVKPKRVTDELDNGTKKKVSFCHNSKKRNTSHIEHTEQRKTNKRISKDIRIPRKVNQSLIITEKMRNNHNCARTAPTKQLKTVEATKQSSTANRRITLIKQRLECISEQVERANAQDKRNYEQGVPVKFHMASDTKEVSGQIARVENQSMKVNVPKTRVVKQIVRAGDESCREEEHAQSLFNAEEHVLDNGENDMGVGIKENSTTLPREHEEVARDTSMIRKKRNSEKVTSMNDTKPTISSRQEPRIVTKKVRKMWTKDIHNTLPIIKSYDVKSVCDNDNSNGNLKRQESLKGEEIWQVKTSSLSQENEFHDFSSDRTENKKQLNENSDYVQRSKNQTLNANNQPGTSLNENLKTISSSDVSREVLGEGERIFLTGGLQKNDYFARKAILELNPKTGSYTTRGATQYGRYNHGIAQLKNFIYLIGGNSGFFEQLRSVECYSPEHSQCTMKPSMREARDEFSLVVCDGCLFAIGGHNGIQDLRSVEKFNARENSWNFVSPMRNYRAGACAVSVDDRFIYVIGGFDGQTYLTSVEQYDVTNDIWIEIQPISTKRAYSCTVLLERAIYIFGGFDGQNVLSSCEKYDIEVGTWDDLPQMNTPRMNGTAVLCAGGVFVIGGECDSVFLETVEYYNMKNKTWIFVSHLPQPMAGLRACVFLEESKTQKK